MACNHCGSTSSVRVERASNTPSFVARQERIPLRPLRRAIRPVSSTIRVIRPANHLDKRT
jgi:hypothetical protein